MQNDIKSFKISFSLIPNYLTVRRWLQKQEFSTNKAPLGNSFFENFTSFLFQSYALVLCFNCSRRKENFISC